MENWLHVRTLVDVVNVSSLVNGVHSSEGQIDSLVLTADVAGKTMEPVLLSSTLHQKKRSGEERKANKIGRTVFLSELENSDGSEGDWSDCRISSQLRVDVCVPAAHVVAVSVEVHEARVEIVPSHRDQPMQQVEKLRRPVEVLLQGQARVVVVAGAVPGHQAGFVLPLASDFNLKEGKIPQLLMIPSFQITYSNILCQKVTHLKTSADKKQKEMSHF